MTNRKRDINGKLRDDLGQFANDQAEPGTTLTARAAPDRAAYVVEIDVTEARSVVSRAYGIKPEQQATAASISTLTCIAATNPSVAAADRPDRHLVLTRVRAQMDMTGFDAVTAAPGFIADTAVKNLIALVPRERAGVDGTLTSSDDDYEAAVRREIPVLSDRDVGQAVSDFRLQPEGFRRSNLTTFAMMGERATWINSQTNRTAAPAEYPFLSVPATATIAVIDGMLMHDFEHTNPKEIASALSYIRWGSVYIEAAVRDRIGQLRPELLDK